MMMVNWNFYRHWSRNPNWNLYWVWLRNWYWNMDWWWRWTLHYYWFGRNWHRISNWWSWYWHWIWLVNSLNNSWCSITITWIRVSSSSTPCCKSLCWNSICTLSCLLMHSNFWSFFRFSFLGNFQNIIDSIGYGFLRFQRNTFTFLLSKNGLML